MNETEIRIMLKRLRDKPIDPRSTQDIAKEAWDVVKSMYPRTCLRMEQEGMAPIFK